MNINKLMKQAQKMQEQMAKTQAELEDKTTVSLPPAAWTSTVLSSSSA